jgi:HAD superfamily hydrolase (TIGR01490 family)
VAIFDLDRTLVPGSSLVTLARELARRRLVGRAQLLRHAGRQALFARKGLGDRSVEKVRTTALAALAGREADTLVPLAREVGRSLATQVFPGARWLLDCHLSAGDFCVILSASPQELVEGLAAALGAHRAVGTRAEVEGGCYTGALDGPFCYGPGKLARLRSELGALDLDRAAAYADSCSDLPLLAACGRPVAVNPDRRLRSAARDEGWPVIELS